MRFVSDTEVPRPPEFQPPGADSTTPPDWYKKPPAWSYFLTPAAVVLGSIIIAGVLWWTRDSGDSSKPTALPVVGAVSTVDTSMTPAAATAMSLKDQVYAYARQIGLDQQKFDACINDPQTIVPINADLNEGRALGVTGTPTFFINNKKLVGAQPAAILDEIIQAELKGSPTSLDGYSPAIKELASTSPPNFEIVANKPDIANASLEGKANAKVTIVEFSDFQCPFCKQWNDTVLGPLRKKLGSDVSLAFLHFPLVQIHPNAGNASLVAACAGAQGKFWQMHDLLFSRQTEWALLK
jgi:protein-disulfide isomerase